MAGLTWLHLSDWHQEGKEFKRRKVRDALKQDIKNRATKISTDLEKIDFIVFSGDVAWRGKAEEYEAAIKEFFNPLLQVADIGRERLFIVPGNHDLDRDALKRLPSDLLGQFTNKPEEINEWLTDEDDRDALLKPMKNYSQFLIKYLGKKVVGSEPAYSCFYSLNAASKKIVVIGLNSAWLSGCYKEIKNGKEEVNDYGHLILGEVQVYEALEKAVDAEILIAVLHHPFNWLINAHPDSIQIQDHMKKCHFILRGHEHEPKVTFYQDPTGDYITISAGSSYDRQGPTAPRYANGYNFVHLNFETGQGAVYLRRYIEPQGWIKDIITTGDKESGYFDFPLPKALRGKKPDAVTEPIIASSPESDNQIAKLKRAIDRLREKINSSEVEALSKLDNLEKRLTDNLKHINLLDSEENLTPERDQIIHALNRLALRYTRRFLNDLVCSGDEQTPTLIPLTPFLFVPEIFPTFQGRTVELEGLEEKFSEVITKKGGLSVSQSILIYGDIGVGKSRLINVFADRLLKRQAAYVVIRTFGDELAPNQMIAQLAADVFYQYKNLPSSAEDFVTLISALIKGKLSDIEGFGQQDISISLWNLIENLASYHPLVIVLEEIENHPRLIKFFEMTAKQQRYAPVLIIGTARTIPQGMKLRSSEYCRLDNLDEPDMQELVDELCYPSDFKREFYDKLYGSTEGNPYFTIEIVEYLKNQGILDKNLSSGRWGLRESRELPRWTPDNLIRFAQDQLRQLEEQNERAGRDLKKAAIIGRRFLFRLLQQIANYSDNEKGDFERSIEAMETQKLLQSESRQEGVIPSDDTFHFRSPIVQEGLYEENPRLHFQIAELLGKLYDDPREQERLRFWRAWHYQRAGYVEEAIHFLRGAINDAEAKRQPFDTIWLIEHILRYYGRKLGWDGKLDLKRILAARYSEVGQLEDALKIYEDVIQIASEYCKQEVIVEIYSKIGQLKIKQEHFDEAEEYFEKALDLLRQSPHLPDHLHALIYRRYASLFLERVNVGSSEKQQDLFRAEQYMCKAREYLEKCNDFSNPDRKRDLVLLLNNKGRWYKEFKRNEEAIQCFKDALDWTRKGATEKENLEAYMLNNLGTVFETLEQYDEAENYYRESLKITDREENMFLRIKSYLNLASIYYKLEKYEKLIPEAAKALWYAKILDNCTYQCWANCMLGEAYVAQGHFDEARSYYEQARKLKKKNPVCNEMLKQIGMHYKEEKNG